MRRRVSWGFLDQALSSITNFAGTIVAARELAPAHLGQMAVAAAVYMALLTLSRGAFSETILLRHSAARTAGDAEIRTAAGLVVAFSLLASAVTALGAALFMHDGLRWAFISLAVLLPLLLFQDFLRFLALTFGSPQKAVAMDGGWLVLQAVAIAVLAGSHWTAASAIVAWLLPGALSSLIGVALLRVVPSPRGLLPWLRANRGFSVRFALDGLIAQSTGPLLLICVTLVSVPSETGFLRVGQTVYGPLVVLYAGIRLALVPELVRLRTRDRRRFDRLVLSTAVCFGLLAVLWGLAAWAIPSHVGRAAFGASWHDVHRLLLPLAVSVGAGGVAASAFAGIRACGDARGGLNARINAGILNLLAGTIGAAVAGAFGAVIALCVSAPFGAVAWWLYFRRARARSVAESPPKPARVPVGASA